MSIRIILADDHEIMRQGLRSLLEREPDMQVIGEAADGRAAVSLAVETEPDIAVMDITMPDLNGMDATRQIRVRSSRTRIIALSMHSSRRFLAEMLKAGASGYLLKECAFTELLHAIRTVAAGHFYLSPQITEAVVDDYIHHMPDKAQPAFSALTTREREVLQLIAEGRTTKEMAARLHVSVKTIESHRAQIMNKLQIHSVAGLTKFAISEGLTSPDP